MGVLRRGKKIVFLPGALDGEDVRWRMTDRKKGVVTWGEAVEILTPSPRRQAPLCPHYRFCGGCQLLHASYAHQLEIKRSILERALSPLRRSDEEIIRKVQPVIPSPEPYGYRNKGVFAIRHLHGGSPAVSIGFYGRLSNTVAGHGCPALFSRTVNTLLDALASWLEKISPIDELPRHVLIRESKSTGRIALVLIGDREPSWLPAFIGAFASTPAMSGLGWLTSPDKPGPTLRGKPKTLWGSLVTEEYLDPIIEGDAPLRFHIGPDTFFQVNTRQANVLYHEVLQACSLAGGETAWDLYCGSGTISLFLALRAKTVLGIDNNTSSIRDARENARQNALSGNLRFITGAAEAVAPSLLSGNPPDVIVLDPPAKGAETAVLEAMILAQPQKIVYISCDPATLSRDLGILISKGDYTVAKIQPLDMFPQTAHVETIVSLQHRLYAEQ